MTPDKLKAAIAICDTNDISSIATALGVSRASIYRALADDQAIT